MSLSGNKNIDYLIMEQLDDRSLLNLCLTNKYTQELCRNDLFWQKRFVSKFNGRIVKPEGISWKNYYLQVISDLSYVEEELELEEPMGLFNSEFFYNVLGGRSVTLGSFLSRATEQYINRGYSKLLHIYYLFNLGNSIKIGYPIDRYGELEPIVREYKTRSQIGSQEYKTKTYFTPNDIIGFIGEFYEEPVSPEELEIQQDIENPLAEDYSLEDAREGHVRRADLVNLFIEGLYKEGDIYFLQLGS